MEYDEKYAVRRVDDGGKFLWDGRRVALSIVLKGERVGLLEATTTCTSCTSGRCFWDGSMARAVTSYARKRPPS